MTAAVVAAAAPPAWSERPPEPRWWERSRLTGEWGGWRQLLAARGIVARASYTTGFWSNVRGGFETGTRYEGFAQWALFADFEALFGWKGGSFRIDWYSYHGGLPSEDLVGLFPTQTISGWETAESVRFYEIVFRQAWGNGRFIFQVGQQAADTEFFVSENASHLLNGTFGFLGLGRTREIAPFYPLAAPGAYFKARTQDRRWEAHVGVYTADPGVDESSNFGFGWSFDNGAFFLGELRARRSPWGRAGSYAIGVAASTAELENFDSGGTVRGEAGIYALIDQLLLAEQASRPGLGFFVRSYGVPTTDRAALSWYLDFGLTVTRPFPGRSDDLFSLGFAHLKLSGDLVEAFRAQGEALGRRQSVLEVTYRLQALGWLTLQPNLQFFFDPVLSRRDATVIGLRAVIEL